MLSNKRLKKELDKEKSKPLFENYQNWENS